MTKPDNGSQLSIEQQNAIDLLLQGRSDREVAEQVGVARPTVTGWRNHNALFQAELNRRRQDVWGAQTERLRGLLARAVDVLEDDLQAPDPRLRQAAAVHILKSIGLYGESLTPGGLTDASAIQRQWAEQQELNNLLRMF